MPHEKRRTPESYITATWRCTLPADADGSRAVAFNMADGTVLRLYLDAQSARHVHETFAPGHDAQSREWAAQSAMSVASPSAAVSRPLEADQV